MINIKEVIDEELRELFDNVNTSDPIDWTVFPVIQYRVVEEYDMEKTYMRYEINIWNRKSTVDIASEINKLFVNLGFERISCIEDLSDSKFKHKIISFESFITLKDIEGLR